MVALSAALLGLISLLVTHSIPKTYPIVENPIAVPDPADNLGGGLDGFDSPYLGSTGHYEGTAS